MSIIVEIPPKNTSEREYIVNTLFREFLGVEYTAAFNPKAENYKIILPNGRHIEVVDGFFNSFKHDSEYLDEKNIPSQIKCLQSEFLPEEVIPVIFGEDKILRNEQGDIVCWIDFFSSAFFMLSRWEEAVCSDRDNHDRFPAKQSLAYREGFLNKPVVNIYAEMIWNMLKHLGYEGKRKERNFSIEATHDVDTPYRYAFMTFFEILRLAAGDILKRRDPVSAFKNVINFCKVKSGNLEVDPYNSFNFIMDVSESLNIRSTFFFISEITDLKHDCLYNMYDGKIVDLIQKIDKRGHFLGLHGSYNSYNSDQLGFELKKLQQVCLSVGIQQKIVSSRQHFLRWKTPETFQHLEEAGVRYDTTLTYADYPGFRTGSCYSYSVFNVKTRKQLQLIERPLILMECTLFAERYLNLSFDNSLRMALELRKECMKYNGTFSVLWHNSELDIEKKRNLYVKIMRG